MKNELLILAHAIQFLTRLPVPLGDAYTAARMSASVRYYPLVGLLVGALSATVFWLLQPFLPELPSLILSIMAGLLITGAFHEDGLADTFDGIGGGVDREQALIIMRDSRLGTYGTLALISAIALKITSLTALDASQIPIALVLAHGLSRLSSVAVLASSSYVRDEGAGKPVAKSTSGATLLIAAMTGVLAVLGGALVLSLQAVLTALAGLALGHIAMRAFFERKLGGYTGDTLGAVQQTSELGFYLGLAACL